MANIARAGRLFTVQTDDGRVFQARSLVAATGSFHRPHLPTLPGQEAFGGGLLHSFAYRNSAPFQDQRVVGGAGNSAVQIAAELARFARVTLATHTPIRFVNQRPYGHDIHRWWWLTGFDRRRLDSTLGTWLDRLSSGTGPRVLDTGVYRAALAAGMPERRPMFTRFTSSGVVWDDGRAEDVDSVIFATGYGPNLAYLAPLGALDAEGRALQRHGISLTVPGLSFVGLANQRTYTSATLRGVGPDAALVVRHLTHYLAAQPPDVRAARWWSIRTVICCPAR